MRKVSLKNNENGFSMIEMLVAVTILAVGLLAVAGLQGTAINRNGTAMNHTEATALIEDKIEEYRDTPYTSISEGTLMESDLGADKKFTRTSTVRKDAAFETKTITVQVAWSDSRPHTLSFQTVVAN